MNVGPQANHPLRLLLWMPWSGGGAIAASRLFSLTDPAELQADVVLAEQGQGALFPHNKCHVLGDRNIRKPLALARFLYLAKKWIRQNAKHYDLFYGIGAWHGTVLPAVTMERCGVPAVIKAVSSPTGFAPQSGFKRCLALSKRRRRLAREISAIVAISQRIASELRSYGFPAGQVHNLPNGVDTKRFYPADANEKNRLRSELNIPDKPTLLFVGAIMPRKRPHLLLDAIHKVLRKGHDCQVVFVGQEGKGTAKYANAMDRRIKELGIEDSVIRRNFTPHIDRYYRAADFFSLPSAREGMPNALLEAMASGLPSIATSVSGSEDLIEKDVNGFLVEPDSAALAGHLGRYLEDQDLARRHGRNATETVRRKYSAEKVLRRNLNLFQSLVSNKHSGL